MHRDQIPPGTLYLLILTTLAPGHNALLRLRHRRSIQLISEDVLTVEEGSLYPALQRMLAKGWMRATWGTTTERLRARYYRLTRAGRHRLRAEVSHFQRVFAAITRISEAVETA